MTTDTFDDTYSAEIIAKARDLSAELDEYVVTQQYLVEASQDEVTSLWLRNKLIIKLIAQLNDRGIHIDANPDDLCDQPIMVQAILFLRSKFDEDRMYEFLKDHEDVKNDILELVGNDDDCLDDIVNYCHESFPIDEGWEYLFDTMNDRPGVISSTCELGSRITGVCEKLERLGESDPISDEVRGSAEKFVGYLGNRKQKILEVAKTIYASTASMEGLELVQKRSEHKSTMIDIYMRDFEKQLARPRVVNECISSENLADTLNNIRDKYSLMWRHSLQYWCSAAHNDEIPTNMDFAVMIATMFVDAGAGQDAKAKVIDVFEQSVDMLGNRYDEFRKHLDNALANIVVYEEGAMRDVVK